MESMLNVQSYTVAQMRVLIDEYETDRFLYGAHETHEIHDFLNWLDERATATVTDAQ